MCVYIYIYIYIHTHTYISAERHEDILPPHVQLRKARERAPNNNNNKTNNTSNKHTISTLLIQIMNNVIELYNIEL